MSSPPILPKRPALQVRSAPRYSEVYWCDFPIFNWTPEFDDRHPCVVIRTAQRLSDPILVMPITTRNHDGDAFAYELPDNPIPHRTPKRSWVVCNHIYTVAAERLSPVFELKHRNPIYPKLPTRDMHAIGRRAMSAMARLVKDSLPWT